MINANTKVVRHSFGIKELSEHSRISPFVAANEYLKKKAVLEHCEFIEKKTAASEKEFETKKAIENVYMKKITEAQIPVLVNEIYKRGREVLFKQLLFEMFSKSLYLDEEFIIEQQNNLKAVIDSYVNKNGGFALLEKAYKETKSPLLKNMIQLCESVARKVSQRKLKEAQENPDETSLINFELNEEESQEFDYEKEKLGIDELADLVKNKVLTVIQDEKQRQAEEEELYRDLESELSESEESVEESLQKLIIKDLPIEESTLFNSLFRHSYKEALEALHNATDPEVYDDDDAYMYDINFDEEDAKQNEFKGFKTAKDEISNHDTSTLDIDMDLILAEAITKYTLMELAYTIKLEDYNSETVRKISQKLLN
jgi:hypothetical protein